LEEVAVDGYFKRVVTYCPRIQEKVNQEFSSSIINGEKELSFTCTGVRGDCGDCLIVQNDEKVSLYDELSLEMLAGFYYHINKNIENGILSNAMYHEINLIKQVAIKQGISLTFLYDQGSLMK